MKGTMMESTGKQRQAELAKLIQEQEIDDRNDHVSRDSREVTYDPAILDNMDSRGFQRDDRPVDYHDECRTEYEGICGDDV